MTRKEAQELFESKFWEPMSFVERAKFQINEERLCMPFGVFMEAVSKSLKRAVWDIELAHNTEAIRAELELL